MLGLPEWLKSRGRYPVLDLSNLQLLQTLEPGKLYSIPDVPKIEQIRQFPKYTNEVGIVSYGNGRRRRRYVEIGDNGSIRRFNFVEGGLSMIGNMHSHNNTLEDPSIADWIRIYHDGNAAREAKKPVARQFIVGPDHFIEYLWLDPGSGDIRDLLLTYSGVSLTDWTGLTLIDPDKAEKLSNEWHTRLNETGVRNGNFAIHSYSWESEKPIIQAILEEVF